MMSRIVFVLSLYIDSVKKTSNYIFFKMMFGKFVKGNIYSGLLLPFTLNIFLSEAQIYPV